LNGNGFGGDKARNEKIDLSWRDEVDVSWYSIDQDTNPRAEQCRRQNATTKVFRGKTFRDVRQIRAIDRRDGIRRESLSTLVRRVDDARCCVERGRDALRAGQT
jgi:hypothetical protein